MIRRSGSELRFYGRNTKLQEMETSCVEGCKVVLNLIYLLLLPLAGACVLHKHQQRTYLHHSLQLSEDIRRPIGKF